MAARCTTPAAAMHHFGGMGAPWCRCRTSGGGVCFARSGCRITNGQGVVLARRTHRGEIIPKGLYHLSVSVWIVNQQGQYLLSQRHPKKQYPLYWECTGGSVLSGETSLQGAIREVKEELGILLTPGSEKLIYQSRRENVQDFYDVWLFHKDIKIEEMRLQETEVVDVQWVNPDKLFEMFRLKHLHPLITYVDQLIG